MAIEPRSKNDQEKLSTAIQKLADEDPTFTVRQDEETGQTVIGGMGELHLDILVESHEAQVEVRTRTSAPMVAYTARPSAGRSTRSSTPTRSRRVAPASSLASS